MKRVCGLLGLCSILMCIPLHVVFAKKKTPAKEVWRDSHVHVVIGATRIWGQLTPSQFHRAVQAYAPFLRSCLPKKIQGTQHIHFTLVVSHTSKVLKAIIHSLLKTKDTTSCLKKTLQRWRIKHRSCGILKIETNVQFGQLRGKVHEASKKSRQ